MAEGTPQGLRAGLRAGTRAGVRADLPVLVALERDGFDDPWSATSLAALFDDPLVRVVLALPDLGYASLRVVHEEAELLRIAVRRSHHRQGVGRRLLAGVTALAAELGALRVVLEVRADNDAALHLYRQAGFFMVGRRAGYYPGGCDAVLLRLGEPPACVS